MIRILKSRTAKELGVDAESCDSNDNVIVQCLCCNETFIRELSRATIEPHGCAAWQENVPISSLPITIKTPRFECKLIHPDAKLPFRKRVTDAGYDLYSVEAINIMPRGHVNAPTGLALSAPAGWYYTIESRSSMFKRGIVAFNGIIDATYCDELYVGLHNHTDDVYHVAKGDRIAQLIVHRIYAIDVTIVDEFSADYSIRSKNGWGSSGR